LDEKGRWAFATCNYVTNDAQKKDGIHFFSLPLITVHPAAERWNIRTSPSQSLLFFLILYNYIIESATSPLKMQKIK
jgi:hypothetical protein